MGMGYRVRAVREAGGGCVVIVYCKNRDCRSNTDGVCQHRQPAGHESITIEEYIRGPMFSDYEEENEPEEG